MDFQKINCLVDEIDDSTVKQSLELLKSQSEKSYAVYQYLLASYVSKFTLSDYDSISSLNCSNWLIKRYISPAFIRNISVKG